MNIFCTNECPVLSAMDHCKVHCRKMIVELAQMLSTAHRVLDGDTYADSRSLYKTTHKNHPSAIWVRSSASNYEWAYEHFKTLCEMYEADSGKIHKTQEKVLDSLLRLPYSIPSGDRTLPTPAMPDIFKVGSVPEMYKKYLNVKYKEWTTREKPIKLEWYFGKPDWVNF